MTDAWAPGGDRDAGATAASTGPSPSDLLYHLERPDAAAEATLAFVFETLGLRALPAQPPALWARPHLVYGRADLAGPNGLAIPVRPGDRVWGALLDGEVGPAPRALPFDLIGAIGAFLRDEVHEDVGPDGYDEHGRLRFGASLPSRLGVGDTPIVDVYVAHLGRLLRERLGIAGRPRWPEGRVAAIGLSHDVDLPDRYALLGSALRPWRLRRHPRTYLRASRDLARDRLRDPDPTDHWLFDRIMASEADRGFRSTFFFATEPFHARRGAPEDVAYDVRGRRYRAVMREILASGFEVGLHASYRATEEPTWLRLQRARLSELAATEIEGLRHHYWHLVPSVEAALRTHELAGFRYDASIAFNDALGFRRSVASPFHPFDPGLGRPLRTLQLPTSCMDGNLFYVSDDVDAAVAAVDRQLDRIIGLGGLAVIDWHIQTSYPANAPFRRWGEAYQRILASLSARGPSLWVTSLGAIATWVTERARALAPVPAADPIDASTSSPRSLTR